MSLKILFFFGMVIFLIATISYASNLGTVPLVNNIGSENNVEIISPDVYVTNLSLSESSNEITSATITVKNSDSVTHAYNVCIITKAGVLISDTPGSLYDCENTASILSYQTL